MPGDFEIARLIPNDWQRMRAIRLEALKNDPEAFGASYDEEVNYSEEKWRERLENPYLFFAISDGSLVGMIGASLDRHKKSKHIASIHGTYVSPQIRGKGVGKAMLARLLEELSKNPGILKVRLNVALTQPAAVALYEKAGFQNLATLEKELCVDGKYIDVYEMVKFLHRI